MTELINSGLYILIALFPPILFGIFALILILKNYRKDIGSPIKKCQ